MRKRERREASGAVLACTPMRFQWASNGDAGFSDNVESVAGLLRVSGCSIRSAERRIGAPVGSSMFSI